MTLGESTILCALVIVICLWLSDKFEYSPIEHVINLVGGIATVIGIAIAVVWFVRIVNWIF